MDNTQKSHQPDIQAALRRARGGDRATARQMLLKIVESDPAREEVWLWLAGLAESLEDARVYLETVLALNPTHPQARKGLALVRQRLVQEKEPSPPATEPPRCPRCGHPQPEDTPFCPICGYLEGQPAVEEVRALQPIPTTKATSHAPSSVNAEVAPSFILSVAQAEAIDACLEHMAYESEASCIILADITGQLISERGKTYNINTQVLSALAAGELSATQEMARLVGEKARFNLLLHEGEDHSVYLSPRTQDAPHHRLRRSHPHRYGAPHPEKRRRGIRSCPGTSRPRTGE
ncbi:MAG: roadblock/LC7 domain-containing protein [Anaerolineae bacterium]